VRSGEGEFSVFLLRPDGAASPRKLTAQNGHLDIVFPAGEWAFCGLVVKGPRSRAPLPAQKAAKPLTRPTFEHYPPKTAAANRPLALTLRIYPTTAVKSVRLHYRPLNQLAKFKTLENPAARTTFTIPAEDVSARWDLMYYFEVLDTQGGGWFVPDPWVATPYYVVTIE
jgi:hypothetical protein